MRLKTNRPTYAVILFALSVIYMCATFLPFFYSVLHPNEDIERVVAALRDGGTAPSEAADVVEHARAAIGSLTRAIPVGSTYEVTKGIHFTGSHEQTTVSETGYVYLAWFERRQNPMLVAIVLYANHAGQKAYRIVEVNMVNLARGYAIPGSRINSMPPSGVSPIQLAKLTHATKSPMFTMAGRRSCAF